MLKYVVSSIFLVDTLVGLSNQVRVQRAITPKSRYYVLHARHDTVFGTPHFRIHKSYVRCTPTKAVLNKKQDLHELAVFSCSCGDYEGLLGESAKPNP